MKDAMKRRIGICLTLVLALSLGIGASQARYLNPATGRFQTMDSYEGSAEEPLSLHKYVYANGNAVNRIDPSGRFADMIMLLGATYVHSDEQARNAARVQRQEQKAKIGIAMTAAVMAIVALETLPLGEVQPLSQPKPVDILDPENSGPKLLFRSMMEERGMPKVGDTKRTLGVVAGTSPVADIMAGPGNAVTPGTGGMSVAVKTPMNLPVFRRPRLLMGTGKDAVWGTLDALLGPDLQFRQDTPTHGLVEPSRVMTLEAYRKALAGTQEMWMKVVPGN